MTETSPIDAGIIIDPTSGDNMLAVMPQLPKPDNAIKMPLVVAGPWTKGARWNAANKEVEDLAENYLYDAMKKRNWTPRDNLPLDEMEKYGHLLSDDTITITQAYLGIEAYVGDYVFDGLNLIGKQRARRDIHLVWGMEESKHYKSWERVLLHSGKRTQKELDEYIEQVNEHTWKMGEDHPGLDTPLGVVAYAMVQERATYHNYEEARKVIRKEYGLPEKPSPFELKRRMEIGAAGAYRTVAKDEIAHHGLFLKMTNIYLTYMPEQMMDALVKVFKGFHMPALNLIPDGADFERVVRETGIHTPRTVLENVNNPIINALGFKNKRALERAAQEAKILPNGLGPQYVGVSQSGEWVLASEPNLQTQAENATSGVVFASPEK